MQRVLLLSDLPVRIQAVSGALRRDGVVVRTETNVERGVASLVQWQPDLLVVDCALVAPGPAFELLQRDGLAVIAVVDEDMVDEMSEAPGVDDFVFASQIAFELWTRALRLDSSTPEVAEQPEVLRRGGLQWCARELELLPRN